MRVIQGLFDGIAHNGQIFFGAALVFKAFQHGAGDKEVGQNIAQACGNFLFKLKAAAEAEHAHVGHQRKVCGQARHLAVVAGGFFAALGCRSESTVGEREPEAAESIGEGEVQVAAECFFEGFGIIVHGRAHFFQHKRMAANRALAEDNHAAGEDIRAFHSDGHGNGLVGCGQIVARAQHHGAATVNIHRVIQGFAHAFGVVVFQNRRNHAGFFAAVERGERQILGGFHLIGIHADARKSFVHAFKFADGQAELVADAGIKRGGVARHFAGGHRVGGQGNTAAH